MSIISVSGRINSGKDTVGLIIQYLIWKSNVEKGSGALMNYKLDHFRTMGDQLSGWKIKKFADKLKDIVCLLIGCSREQLEDQDFKNKVLPEEWDKFAFYRENTRKPLRIYSSREIFKGGKVEILKMTPRLLLQVIGTECIRDKVHPNCWVNALFAGYKPITTTESFYDEKANNYTGITNKSTTSFPNWIITDTRFENELKAIKDRGGITIRVNRELKRTSKEWQELFPEPKVLDPDGWHRDNRFQYEWYEELITLKEYQSRVMRSTVRSKIKFEDQFKVDAHPSENALDNEIFDYHINNDGTIDDLIEKVKIILQKENII